MHPIERLRYVARAGDEDPVLLAEEAALGLGAMAFDPRALVPSARRLIDSHPTCGPIWWVSARLVVAEDLSIAVNQVLDDLAGDPTFEEVAAAFPSAAVVSSGLGRNSLAAFELRPDLEVRLVGSRRKLRYALRALSENMQATSFELEEVSEACEGADVVLVEALAAGPGGCLVNQTEAGLAREAIRREIPIWAVVGVGQLLSEGLFSALLSRVGAGALTSADADGLENLGEDLDEDDFDDPRDPDGRTVFIETASLSWVIGPYGVSAPGPGLKKTNCPSPIELQQKPAAGRGRAR